MKYILTFILSFVSFASFSQEVYVDTITNATYFYLGSKNEKGDSIKVAENGKISWKSKTNLEHAELLLGRNFLDEVFGQNLCFILEGSSSYWRATINSDKIEFFNYSGEVQTYLPMFYSENESKGSEICIMFSDTQNKVFGVLNNCHVRCDYDWEAEAKFFEAYICVNGLVYRGCARIEKQE